MHINIEIKARCKNHEHIRQVLLSRNARFIGIDHQIDTYFKVDEGRLKLRQGNIENALIFYKRTDQRGPKKSEVQLFRFSENGDALKEVLTASNGVQKIVDKKRAIYFVENVKIHLDDVKNLGTFVEIEAIEPKQLNPSSPDVEEAALHNQCQVLMHVFHIQEKDLISHSYCDL